MMNCFDSDTMDKIGKVVDNYTNVNNIDSLYHFTSIGALYSIIEGQSLRLTESTFMNDKSEYIESLTTISKVANEMSKKVEYSKYKEILIDMANVYNDFFDQHRTNLEDAGHNVFYIFSTCTNFDSVPMWNYYSSKTGVCIEFDREKLNDMIYKKVNLCNNPNEYKWNYISNYRCIYEEKTKHEYMEKLISVALPAISKDYDPRAQNKRHGLYVDFSNTMRKYAYILKDKIFKYEEEHRSIIEFVEDSNCNHEESTKSPHITRHFYTTDDTIRPCITIKLDHKLPIKSIYVAPTSLNETVVRGIKLLLKYHKYEHVKVNKLQLSIRNNY